MKITIMKNILKGLAIFFVLFVGFIFFALNNQIGGWRAFIVSSASMQPAIQTGALVITHYVHPTHLQINDVVTFIPPIKNREFVTHRITKVIKTKNLTTFKTKGDNNNYEDSWIIAGGGVVGKVIYTIPYLGYLFSFSQTKLGILFFILLPASYIILGEITTIISLIKKKRPKNIPQPETITAVLLFSFSLTFFSPQPTYARLADITTLTQNSFSFLPTCDKEKKEKKHPKKCKKEKKDHNDRNDDYDEDSKYEED